MGTVSSCSFCPTTKRVGLGLDSLKCKRGVDNMGNGWGIPWTEREQLLTTRKGRQVGAGVPCAHSSIRQVCCVGYSGGNDFSVDNSSSSPVYGTTDAQLGRDRS